MLYEKAVSKKQQRFFGIVRAAQKGTLEGEASPQVQRAASNMTKSDVKKMASTKHKGLPEKKVVKETSYKESFATNKYKEMAKREADLKRKEDLKVKTKKESVDIDEAKYEKGASNYGKASIRNKRMFGKGGNAAPPEERGAAIQARKTRHQERRHVKKGNKYHEPGKHRPEVYGVNKPEEERKGKNVKEGVKYGLYKGDGKVKFKLNKPEKKKEKELKEYSPNVSYQAKGGKKSGKLSKSSVYSLRGKDESKKDFRKSHTKDIKDGLMKKESIFTPLVFTTERLGGKGYSRKATKGGGDWPDSDRGEGNKATRRAGGKVKAKSPTYIAHVKNKQKVKEEVTSIYEGVLSKFGKKKEKKVEKKPEKAMDAGSRGRRLLQRREYKAKVSEFIPKELEDQYTPNGELVSELDLKKIGSAVWNKTTNILSKLNQKRKDNAASRKKWRDENPGGTISKQTHLNQIRNQGGDTSHWEEVQKEDIADIIARLEKKRISKGGDPEDSPLPAMKKYHADKKKKKVKKEEVVDEGKKKGLWDNIHAKRKRGEKPAKPGDKDYPKTLNVEGLKKARKNVGADTCWDGYKAKGTKKKGGKEVPNCVKEDGVNEGAAWTKKSGKSASGGLNEKGRKSYERDNPGSDLKAPQPEGGSRKKSFCARMGGMKKKLTSSKTANDPDSRINKALRKWKCNEATRLKKEKGYEKGGTKGKKDPALAVVIDRIRKDHGVGAVIGQGSRQAKKVKGAKSTAGTGKYKKAADAKKQTAGEAKKRGFKSSQDYVNTIARYGGKDNYDKGRGLGT